MRRVHVIILLAGALTVAWLGWNAAAQRGVSEPERDAFEQRVRDYLLENPEVIMEALQVLEQKRRTAEAENLKRTIAAHRDELLNDPEAPVAGNPSGDVALVEFFDYNCPYCRRVAGTVTDAIEEDAGLRLVYKELPILGPGSQFAARAALASRRQGKYREFHDALMNADEQVNEDTVLEIAREVGLDLDRLEQDMKDPAIDAAIDRNRALANALGITGTPSFVIGDHVVPGAVDRTTLDSLVARARQGS